LASTLTFQEREFHTGRDAKVKEVGAQKMEEEVGGVLARGENKNWWGTEK